MKAIKEEECCCLCNEKAIYVCCKNNYCDIHYRFHINSSYCLLKNSKKKVDIDLER